MSITAERRTALVQEYATAANDTGSPEVQIALASERISNLTEHLKTHAKRPRSPSRICSPMPFAGSLPFDLLL